MCIRDRRDWGHAKDYVEAMWLMLQHDIAEDYVVATGVTTSVREFIKMSFKEVGIEIIFKGTGVNEKGYIDDIDYSKIPSNLSFKLSKGDEIVAVNPRYFRPSEVELLLGDPTKIKDILGWTPKYNVQSLCSEMVQADVELFLQNQLLKEAGFSIKNEYE